MVTNRRERPGRVFGSDLTSCARCNITKLEQRVIQTRAYEVLSSEPALLTQLLAVCNCAHQAH